MTKDTWLFVAKTLLASRLIDTIEETELAPSGKVTYQFSSRGHELAQIILATKLTQNHDGATVYYRSRPFVLGAGMTIQEAFAGPMAKSGSRNGGRDIGVVHNLPPRGNGGVTVLPASGDVGSQYTPAMGWAQAALYRSEVLGESEWNTAISVAFGGDASVASNGFWSALNAATTQNYPMIFFIEDNGFGISVPGEFQTPGANIAENLSSFKNLYILDGDGADPEEAERLIEQAVLHCRNRISPVLLRMRVPRLCGHSSVDLQAYKSKEMLADELQRDPLPRLQKFLTTKKIISKKGWEELEQSVQTEVRNALNAALAEPEPTSETVHKFAFSDSETVQEVGGLLAEGIILPTGNSEPVESETRRMNLIEAVRKTMEEELAVNSRLLIFGEDVGVKGGVHGATVDLQIKFGEDRVFDTSLSEEGIIGRAIGMAYAGLMPIPEIQFRKYADPATEQINECGTIRWRTNGTFAAPIVVRIPFGYSKRTGDPWHSVSHESVFAHQVGWRIAIPSNARDAVGLLRSAMRGNDPTMFFEHRNLLDTSRSRTPYPGSDYVLPFGVARTVQEGTKATIITWGDMVYRAIDAVALLGESVEILDLRTIIPWDQEAVLRSVKKTNRCLVLHEDTMTCGFGGEIVATIAQEAFSFLDAPVERIAPPDIPVPYNKTLMEAVIPTAESIAKRLRKLLDF